MPGGHPSRQIDTMQTAVRAQLTVASAQQAKTQPRVAVAVPRVAKALGAGLAGLALAASANAATVKLGSDSGAQMLF